MEAVLCMKASSVPLCWVRLLRHPLLLGRVSLREATLEGDVGEPASNRWAGVCDIDRWWGGASSKRKKGCAGVGTHKHHALLLELWAVLNVWDRSFKIRSGNSWQWRSRQASKVDTRKVGRSPRCKDLAFNTKGFGLSSAFVNLPHWKHRAHASGRQDDKPGRKWSYRDQQNRVARMVGTSRNSADMVKVWIHEEDWVHVTAVLKDGI